MKAQLGKYGPLRDYRHAQVSMLHKGRTLLGDIKDVYRHPVTGVILCKINHFNGEPWPFEPRLLAVDILDQSCHEQA